MMAPAHETKRIYRIVSSGMGTMAVGVLLALAAGLAAADGSPSWSGGEGAGDRSLPTSARCSGMGVEGTVYASSGEGMAPPASPPRNDALRCPRTIRGYHPCGRGAAGQEGACIRGDKPFPGRAQGAVGRRVSLGGYGRAARWSLCRGPLDHARRAAGMGSAPCSATRGRGVTAFTAAPEDFTGPDVQNCAVKGLTAHPERGKNG
jgi:hypothetical protein